MRSVYSYLGLWRIALRRFSSEPVLTFCLLLGWSVVVALASAPPMYTDAANRSLLQHELQTVPNRSAFSFFYHYVKGSSVEGADWDAYAALDQYMETRYSQDLGLPHRSDMHYVKSDLFQVFPLRDGQYEVRDRPLLRGYLGFIDRLEEYVSVAEGEFPAQANVEGSGDGVVDVLVSEEFAVEAGLQVGEGYTLFDPSARTSTGNVVRLEIPIRIAGIWIPRTEGGATWHLPALSFANVFLVPENTYISEIGARVPHALTDVGWYKVVDGDSVRAEDVDRFLGRVNRVDRQIKSRIATTYLELSPVSALRRYRLVASTQAILLLLFSIPILGLVLYFIVLIADSTVKRQQIEISILKSRGATTGQVFSIYLLQGATLGIFALAVGPELGKLVAQFIGGTRYFMTFEAQTPLHIETTTTSMTYTVVAIGGALLATVLPAMGAARLAIVEAKQEVSRRQRRSFWERSYLDFLLLGVASYGYYMLRTQGRIAFLQADVPADPLDNPLAVSGAGAVYSGGGAGGRPSLPDHCVDTEYAVGAAGRDLDAAGILQSGAHGQSLYQSAAAAYPDHKPWDFYGIDGAHVGRQPGGAHFLRGGGGCHAD